MITPLALIPDLVLSSIVSRLPALTVTSHDGVFSEDDDQLTDAEKRDAQNDVFRSRNAVERVMYMHDSVYSVKPGELYFSDNDDGLQTVGTITEASGLYPPYIPIISDKTSTTLTLLTGPSHHVEVRMRRVVASDDAFVWEFPSYLAAAAQLNDGNGVIYCPATIRLDKIADRPAVCIFSSRLVIGSLVSDWSEPSAACMI